VENQSENNKKTWQEPKLMAIQIDGGTIANAYEDSKFYNYWAS